MFTSVATMLLVQHEAGAVESRGAWKLTLQNKLCLLEESQHEADAIDTRGINGA